MKSVRCLLIVGAICAISVLAGCGTEPSGGKLPPPPPPQTAEEAAASYKESSSKVFEEMAKQPAPGMGGPGAGP